ncbi:NAD(P)-binding protein [Hypoxylon crocopeplum]|nr:NAD(P)-binding protein [Hypoxylon crocopeplum]
MSSELGDKAWFEATGFGFICRQFTRPKPILPNVLLTDQVAIITGSNVGLGLAASRQLLKLELSHLVIGVRSQVKGDEAAIQLRKEFPASLISVWTMDLESYDSIRAFADRCATLPRIDIVILNAGLSKTYYSTCPATDHEVTLQVNYLSTALLAILFLPILKAKKAVGAINPPVVTIVGSDLAYQTDIHTKGPVLQQFNNPEAFSQFPWYSKSKLLLTLFVSKLAEFVSPDEVLINMANPGMTRGTEFFREFSNFSMWLVGLAQLLFARSVDVAATTYVDAAVAQGKGSHGSFLSDWKIKPYPKVWYTPEGREVRERLWEETMEELNFAGASKIVTSLKPT